MKLWGLSYPYIPSREWEGLQEKYEIDVQDIKLNVFPDGCREFEIFRDEEYQIKGKISGVFEKITELEMFGYKELPGTSIEPYNIHIKDEYLKIDYEIEGIIFNGVKSQFSTDLPTFELDMYIDSVLRHFNNSSKLNTLTDWFLNGPHKHVYTNRIFHDLNRIYKRRLLKPGQNSQFFNNEFKGLTDTSELESFASSDYIFVEFRDEDGEDKYFTIQSVPDDLGPEWSKNIGIEYRFDWWIPDDEERKKIAEIVGFLFGKQLINIGYTKFGEEGNIIEDLACDPGIPGDIQSISEKSESPPIETTSFKITNNYRDLGYHFKNLIPKYLILRSELKLNEVLWKYWLAQNLPIEARIIVMSAGLELLYNSWYKSSKSESKGEYLPKEEFENSLKCEFKKIDKKLANKFTENPDYKDRIVRKIKNSYNMGFNEKIHFFFKEEIGLDLGSIEKKAIKYRNKPAHGNHLNKKTSMNCVK